MSFKSIVKDDHKSWPCHYVTGELKNNTNKIIDSITHDYGL